MIYTLSTRPAITTSVYLLNLASIARGPGKQ